MRPSESISNAATISPDDRRRQLALAAARTAAENRGRDVTILDMRELTRVFDYFVIATGTSRRQLHAMADEIDDVLSKELGCKRLGVEGYDGSHWVLLDYGEIVVHLFDEPTRDYYALERLWCDSKRVPFEPPAPAMSGF